MRDGIRTLAKTDLIGYGLTAEQAEATHDQVDTITDKLGLPKQTAGESKTQKQI